MSVKVKNRTPVYGPSLCETCERALLVKGYDDEEVRELELVLKQDE